MNIFKKHWAIRGDIKKLSAPLFLCPELYSGSINGSEIEGTFSPPLLLSKGNHSALCEGGDSKDTRAVN